VTVADLSTDGEQIAQQIRSDCGQAQFIRTDIAKEADVQALVDAAVSRFGGWHGAFNNAGRPPFSSAANGFFLLADLSERDFRRAVDVNIIGTFLA